MKPTPKQAAQWFKSRARNTTMPGSRMMFETAIEALEKRIPKKPEILPFGSRCPVCGDLLEETHFCPGCGQLIDWEETE